MNRKKTEKELGAVSWTNLDGSISLVDHFEFHAPFVSVQNNLSGFDRHHRPWHFVGLVLRRIVRWEEISSRSR